MKRYWLLFASCKSSKGGELYDAGVGGVGIEFIKFDPLGTDLDLGILKYC
jgi:hypothetical protein